MSTALAFTFAKMGIALCVFMDVSAAYEDVLAKNEHRLYRSGYKGLAQVSSLSPFMLNLYTSVVEARVSCAVKVLQYADDVAVYILGNRRDATAMEREWQCLL